MKHNIIFAICSLIILTGIGVFVYNSLEGWGTIDTIYFSAISFATIGYGDIHPITQNGRIFTVFYVLFGVSLMLFLLTSLGGVYIENRIKILSHMETGINKLTKTTKEYTKSSSDSENVINNILK